MTFVHVRDPYASSPEAEEALADAASFAAPLLRADLAMTQGDDDAFGEWDEEQPAAANAPTSAKAGRGLEVLSAAAAVDNPFPLLPPGSAPEDGERPRAGGFVLPPSPMHVPLLPPSSSPSQDGSSMDSRKRPRTTESRSVESPLQHSVGLFTPVTPAAWRMGSGVLVATADMQVETNAEIAFLLRHYSEIPGHG